MSELQYLSAIDDQLKGRSVAWERLKHKKSKRPELTFHLSEQFCFNAPQVEDSMVTTFLHSNMTKVTVHYYGYHV